ncbi:DUF456 domain-containing protein [Fulvivirga sediminis]|uniref:DUF456 domain-containing protein n=1 Tax=Fulvivirga sediminis TaxID=2803949 RepID=A0A937JZ99_9BACT|nr:DUF456 domain-containing protein [Fulvivirga sediminis]MBL3656454.1 DUF456 domain-containing protein [Fulvivirga sediminis]
MDLLILIVSAALLLAGVVGSFLPILPGPPLAFIGLLIMQFTESYSFSAQFIWIWLFVTILITVLDYYIPIYGTKRFGGTKYGTWGSVVGLIVGIFLLPVIGVIIGPMLGAFIGELIAGQTSKASMRAAWGSFLGFLAGTFMKVIICLIMIYDYVDRII